MGSFMTKQGVCLVAHLFDFAIRAQTIPTSKHKSSTCVGFRHHVIARHDLFSLGSSMCACAYLAHSKLHTLPLSSIHPMLF